MILARQTDIEALRSSRPGLKQPILDALGTDLRRPPRPIAPGM